MRKRKTEERIKAIEMHKQGIPRRRIAEEPVSYTHLTLPTTPYV